MDKPQQYDIAVIGAGSAGLTAARVAAGFKVRVALLERQKIGGDCLHTGCVPSKTLIAIARKFYQAHSIEPYARSGTDPLKPDITAIRRAIKQSQNSIAEGSDSRSSLEAQGIDVLMGDYSFSDAHTLRSSSGRTVRFRKCIIAAGSKPTVPDIPGLAAAQYVTSDTVWDMKELPESLAVIGAGPIGLELGQALTMLGSTVTILERGDRLISRFDPPISQALQNGLEKNGVRILCNSSVTAIDTIHGQPVVAYRQAEQHGRLPASQLLVAVGRSPATENLGLSGIGIATDDRGGIAVDRKLRTRHKHIYAAGDCLGPPFFTHWASAQAASAAAHALFGVGQSQRPDIVPSATFTWPEVGQVGASEQDLQRTGKKYRKHMLPYDRIDKGIADSEEGFITILTDPQRRVLGAAIVGHDAAELIGYCSLLIARGDRLDALSQAIQAYPTYTFGLRELAATARLADYQTSGWVKALLRLRWR